MNYMTRMIWLDWSEPYDETWIGFVWWIWMTGTHRQEDLIEWTEMIRVSRLKCNGFSNMRLISHMHDCMLRGIIYDWVFIH